jgi:hypothetical protein
MVEPNRQGADPGVEIRDFTKDISFPRLLSGQWQPTVETMGYEFFDMDQLISFWSYHLRQIGP